LFDRHSSALDGRLRGASAEPISPMNGQRDFAPQSTSARATGAARRPPGARLKERGPMLSLTGGRRSHAGVLALGRWRAASAAAITLLVIAVSAHGARAEPHEPASDGALATL